MICAGAATPVFPSGAQPNLNHLERPLHDFLPLAQYEEVVLNLSTQSDAQILAVANPIMDNLMDASTAIDYDRHTRDFTERARRALPREALRPICEQYQRERGFFGPREFVAIFRRPDSVAIIWRQTFTRAAGDFVAEMVLVEEGGRCLVDHVMVF